MQRKKGEVIRKKKNSANSAMYCKYSFGCSMYRTWKSGLIDMSFDRKNFVYYETVTFWNL